MLEVFVVCTWNRDPFDNHHLNHNDGLKQRPDFYIHLFSQLAPFGNYLFFPDYLNIQGSKYLDSFTKL